jgi:hypothetical protein
MIKSGLTSACTRLATALFFNYTLLAKTHFIGAHLAQPQAAEFERWAAYYYSRS